MEAGPSAREGGRIATPAEPEGGEPSLMRGKEAVKCMEALSIQEHDGLWSLREGHAVFPIFEGRPAVVCEYLRRRCQEEGAAVTRAPVEFELAGGHVRRVELAEIL
jgi:hypothetical protein